MCFEVLKLFENLIVELCIDVVKQGRGPLCGPC
jgi:hypothetical protein